MCRPNAGQLDRPGINGGTVTSNASSAPGSQSGVANPESSSPNIRRVASSSRLLPRTATTSYDCDEVKSTVRFCEVRDPAVERQIVDCSRGLDKFDAGNPVAEVVAVIVLPEARFWQLIASAAVRVDIAMRPIEFRRVSLLPPLLMQSALITYRQPSLTRHLPSQYPTGGVYHRFPGQGEERCAAEESR